MEKMRITILGCGTSTGVPVPGCRCAVCQSPDPRNKRLRPSVWVEVFNAAGATSILIDTSTDLRQQALVHGLTWIDAVLYTHTHADHIYGFDDLRAFNFVMKKSIPLYADAFSISELEKRFDYAFAENPGYEGGALPKLSLHEIKPYVESEVAGIKVLPLLLYHGRGTVLGFRIGKFAYLTDCSRIPDETFAALRDLDLVILDGLRDRPHGTHFTVAQAVQAAEQIQAKRCYLTHMAHELEYVETNEKIKRMSKLPIELAYDGLKLEV